MTLGIVFPFLLRWYSDCFISSRNLQPVESWFVSFISSGEGWHNYHHTFPWDYKAAELSMHFNFTASIIRFCERIGLAYDLKTASPEMVIEIKYYPINKNKVHSYIL